jgi:CzcA family heavy metal efflux pump
MRSNDGAGLMRWLVSLALEQRVVVIALAGVLLVYGSWVGRHAPLDVFPEFAPPLVEIQTEAPGLTSLEVEALVTVPLENAVNGVAWLKSLRSKSVLGLSSVVIHFQPGTDLLRARQLVQERVARVQPELPVVARPPVLLSPLSSTSRAMKIGLSSKTLSPIELTDQARWVVRPRLMAIPGVANVAIWGQRDRQLQIKVDPDRLHAHELGLDEVIAVTTRALRPAAGGFVDTPNQRLAVAHRPVATTAAELANLAVAYRGGAALRLGSVAEVVEGSGPPIGDAVINGGPGLLLIVEKQPWGNTLEVTHKVEEALGRLRPALPGIEVDSTIFRPATFIERAIINLQRALFTGCLLVVLILAAFLYDWRTGLISLLALPLSVVAAVMGLTLMGATINTMALAGLVIALGEVVDDAIIDVENILRRLRLERLAPHPRPAAEVVLEASLEVRGAVVHATLIVVLVFLPIYFLGGLAGSFFRPLALAYGLGVLASMAVALIVTPALSLVLLPGSLEPRGTDGRSIAVGPRISPLTRLLLRGYRTLLPGLLARPRPIAWLGLVLVLLSGASVVGLGEGFLPAFQENDFLMHWIARPGSSLEALRRTTLRVSRELMTVPGVRNTGAHLGRAEVADEVVGPNFAEVWLSVDPSADYQGTRRRIQQVVDGYPGLVRDVQTYLQERIKEVLSGASGAVVVRLYGPDLATLRERASAIGRLLAEVPGVAHLKVEPQVEVPQVEVRFRTGTAPSLGLEPGQVRATVNTLLQGTRVGEVYRGDRVVEVVVWGADRLRGDPGALRELRVSLPGGRDVRLGDAAEVEVVPAPNIIQREAASRRIDVTCDVRGSDLGAVQAQIERQLATLSLPAGHHIEILGELAERRQARRQLWLLGLLALCGVVLVLHAEFHSARLALLVVATLPFALVGGLASVWMSGGVLSLGSLAGLVTVLGIAARNGILLISHYRHLEDHEGLAFGVELVQRGAEERLAPIVMTALATLSALVPLVVLGHRPGHEIEHPMAVVILGGLVTSTLLNLFVVPPLYLWLGHRRQ